MLWKVLTSTKFYFIFYFTKVLVHEKTSQLYRYLHCPIRCVISRVDCRVTFPSLFVSVSCCVRSCCVCVMLCHVLSWVSLVSGLLDHVRVEYRTQCHHWCSLDMGQPAYTQGASITSQYTSRRLR